MTALGLVVRRATPDEAPLVHALLTRCGEHLAETRGLTNWLPAYPLERLREECTPGASPRSVWTVWDGGRLVATFTIAREPPVAYDAKVTWSDVHAPALWVNRLAVEPARQGHGLGDWCTAEIERRAVADGCRFVRLDALSSNARLLAFYHRRGYVERGRRTGNGREFTCFEKPVFPPRA